MKPNWRKIKLTLGKRSPEILTAIGIAGMITTVALAVKATPKALELIEEKKEEEQVEQLSVVDTVKTTWKCYIPAAVTGTLSIGCVIGSLNISTRRTAALATAYKVAETALTDYKDKIVEVVGEEKAKEIREKVVEEQVQREPVNKKEIVYIGEGEVACRDLWTGREFSINPATIDIAMAEVNRRIVTDMSGGVPVNDFYELIGIDTLPHGNELGWDLDDGEIKIDKEYIVNPKTGHPILTIDFNVLPHYEYY